MMDDDMGMMDVDDFAESTAAATSNARKPGIVGQAEGTTWDPTKTKGEAKDDADMWLTFGTRRSLQTCAGASLALFTAVMVVFFLFFDAEAIIFGISHCKDVECRRGRCIELGDSAECRCPPAYSGVACETARISGTAYADSVLADCRVLLGLSHDVTNETALARTSSSFDGSFTFMIADVDTFILSLQSVAGLYKRVFVVVLPGDGCRGIGTDVYLPAPMVLMHLAPTTSIEADLVGPSLAVTPLSTLTWSLDTEIGLAEVDDTVRNAFGATGLTQYQMDAGSVSMLSRSCDARCVAAYCNSVKVQNTIAILQPFLNVESGEYPAWRSIMFAISDELVQTARTSQTILSDEGSLNRIAQRAYTRMLGATAPTTAGTSRFQQLFADAVGALSIANAGMDNVCETTDLAVQGQIGTRAVTEAAQRRVCVIGPTGNTRPAESSNIVHSIQMELEKYNTGDQINEASLASFNDAQAFRQLVESVVLLRNTVYSASGTIVSDGYFQRCRVYADLNHDNVWNADEEPYTVSSDRGRYTLVIAGPGASLSSLVEPSCPVRLSQDQSPECTTSVQRRPVQHGLSGTVSDSVISPITSLNIESDMPSVDVIAQCIRSAERNCVESVILSSQIEITLWILAALLDVECGTSQSCLQSTAWTTWETLSASAKVVAMSSDERKLSFADTEQMVELFTSVIETSDGSDAGALDALAALASRLNLKAAAEARDLAQPIECVAADKVVGSTCTEMAGMIDGGKAIVHLLRRQVLVRDMRTQLTGLINSFTSTDQFRERVANLESLQEEKLALLGAFARIVRRIGM